MKRLIVLSSIEQYAAASAAGWLGNDTKILCDNESFTEILKEKQIPHEELTEFDFREQWDEINVWGWSRAADFIGFARRNGLFKQTDLPSVIYLWFTVVFIVFL